ncbi:MAG: hypothetical protein KAQ98_08220 [Bacteriovoracaceae bacterium]|nr:hypothetical protein [Bacteriovoracaceae bacterium]
MDKHELRELFSSSKKELYEDWKGEEDLWSNILKKEGKGRYVWKKFVYAGSVLMVVLLGISIWSWYPTNDQIFFTANDYVDALNFIGPSEEDEDGLDSYFEHYEIL